MYFGQIERFFLMDFGHFLPQFSWSVACFLIFITYLDSRQKSKSNNIICNLIPWIDDFQNFAHEYYWRIMNIVKKMMNMVEQTHNSSWSSIASCFSFFKCCASLVVVLLVWTGEGILYMIPAWVHHDCLNHNRWHTSKGGETKSTFWHLFGRHWASSWASATHPLPFFIHTFFFILFFMFLI